MNLSNRTNSRTVPKINNLKKNQKKEVFMRSLVKGLISLSLVLSCTNTNLAHAGALYATAPLGRLVDPDVTVGGQFLRCNVSNVSATKIVAGTIYFFNNVGAINSQHDIVLNPHESRGKPNWDLGFGYCVFEVTEGQHPGVLLSLEVYEDYIGPRSAISGRFVGYSDDPGPDELTR